MAMFDGLMNFKATGPLAGAMAGMRAPYDLASAEAGRQRDLIGNAQQSLALDTAQKNIPLQDLMRTNEMATQEELIRNRGSIDELTQSNRELAIAQAQVKQQQASLDKNSQVLEWMSRTNEWLNNASPDDLVGEGYARVREEGRALGLPLPDVLDAPSKAKIAAGAQMAINNLPELRKKADDLRAIEQDLIKRAAMHGYSEAAKETSFKNARELQKDRLAAAEKNTRIRAAGSGSKGPGLPKTLSAQEVQVFEKLKNPNEPVTLQDVAVVERAVQKEMTTILRTDMQAALLKAQALDQDATPAEKKEAQDAFSEYMSAQMPGLVEVLQDARRRYEGGKGGAAPAAEPKATEGPKPPKVKASEVLSLPAKPSDAEMIKYKGKVIKWPGGTPVLVQ